MKWLSNLLMRLARLWPRRSEPQQTEQKNDRPAELERPSPPQRPAPSGNAPWLALARAEDGTVEKPGKNHNPRILQYFKDAGFPGISDDETAWCAAFANAMLVRAGWPGTNSLLARSFLTYGTALEKPRLGCIWVGKRGGNSWQGHVGFYVGEDAKGVYVLGGNQQNGVNVRRFPHSDTLGYRWPPSLATSRTIRASLAGSVGSALAVILQGIAIAAEAGLLPLAGELKGLSDYFAVLAVVGSAIAIISYAAIVYARVDDWWKKGR